MLESVPFSKCPHPVNSEANLQPFKISVPDEEIATLKKLLELSRLAPPSWENSEKSPEFGVSRKWMENAVKQWHDEYNWREWEAKFNSLPQYTIDVKDDDGHIYVVHFMGLFSTSPSVIPIVFSHGWPGSVFEFLPLMLYLRSKYPTPDVLPYHIVAPHLIGFGYSSAPPLDKDFTWVDNARIISKMMHLLGFGTTGYVAQGGDLGSAVASAVAACDPACRMVHLNMFCMLPPAGVDVEAEIANGIYRDAEVCSIRAANEIRTNGYAYAALQGTRPATAGFVIGSNPVSLLAWIGEKMLAWSDPRMPMPLEKILTNVSLYWFSNSYYSSQWCYRKSLREGVNTPSWLENVQVPVGYTWFEGEAPMAPRRWIETVDKVKWYRTHEKGGHFAALEQHEAFWTHVTTFVNEFWGKA